MSDTLTLDDLSVPLRALRLLAVDFGHLAPPSVHMGPIYPNQVELSFHDDLAGFEAWREALGIAPDAVTHGTQSDGRTRVLTTSADFAGALVTLTGFAKVPDPAPAGTAA
ncbi:hypothetical protein [Streptomyces griseorubiginosus]|uniref:hypothetical protein n=1 Tax=Streptomyces griseorubiginosus TaxID=67304 RepID=UPI0036E660BD